MARKIDVVVFLVLLLTFVIWSNSFIAIGMLKTKMTSLQLVELRFLPVGLACLAILALFFRKESLAMLRSHPWHLLAMGVLSVPAYNLLLNTAMGYLKPSAGSLLVCLNPLFTLILAVRFLGETYTPRRVAGTVISFLGLAVVVLYGRVGVQESAVIPWAKVPYALMVTGASLSWACYVIISKRLMERYSPVAITYVSLALGSLPLALFIDADLIRLFGSLTPLDHFAWVFLSVGCTVVGFALYIWAVKHWRASTAALFVYLNPPLTIFFAWLLLGQGISGWFFLGGLVMLAGVILATAPGRAGIHRQAAKDE